MEQTNKKTLVSQTRDTSSHETLYMTNLRNKATKFSYYSKRCNKKQKQEEQIPLSAGAS